VYGDHTCNAVVAELLPASARDFGVCCHTHTQCDIHTDKQTHSSVTKVFNTD